MSIKEVISNLVLIYESFYNRFPFLASEIFNCEINSLLDKFFDAPEEPVKEEIS
jgi:hypothetical protein